MGTHVQSLPIFSKLILAANDFPNWKSFSKDDNRAYDMEERKAQWGNHGEADADGCLVGAPHSKHNAYRSRHMHRECKVLIRPDSSRIRVFIMWIPKHTQMPRPAPASSLFAHKLHGAWFVKLSLIIWTFSFQETCFWKKIFIYFKHPGN